jgi:hypothetical protein
MGGASSCVNHAVSHWNVKLGSHNNNTRSRHHRAREVADCVALTLSLFLFSWPSLTGVASSALGIAYAACTRAGDVPESLQNYRTTTARSLDVSMRYIASKHKPRPATSVCRPNACCSLCRHTLHTLRYTVHCACPGHGHIHTIIAPKHLVNSLPRKIPRVSWPNARPALLYHPSTLFAFALAAAPNMRSLSSLHSQGSRSIVDVGLRYTSADDLRDSHVERDGGPSFGGKLIVLTRTRASFDVAMRSDNAFWRRCLT